MVSDFEICDEDVDEVDRKEVARATLVVRREKDADEDDEDVRRVDDVVVVVVVVAAVVVVDGVGDDEGDWEGYYWAMGEGLSEESE